MTTRVWFSSDTHYWHQKILWLGNGRPFETVEEMNETMLDNWNSRVSNNDLVYFLGDLSFGSKELTASLIRKLKGNIHFVRGNHDRTVDTLKHMFASYSTLKEIKVGGQAIVLCHFPLLEWNKCHHGSWHLHGHQHGNAVSTSPVPRIDIGVDCFNFAPVSFEEVAEIMKDREWVPVSHH